jgi:hypothetical protein
MDAGNLAVIGAALQFGGAVVAYPRTASPKRRLIGDTLVYAGFACFVGAFIGWLFL